MESKLDYLVSLATYKKPKSLEEIFKANSRLILTLNDNCNKSCTHCVSSSTPKGTTFSISKFESINPNFFKIFKNFDFGRKGDPFLYHSEGRDLTSIVAFLLNFNPNEITIAPGLFLGKQHYYEQITDSMRRLTFITNETKFNSMITYHHYFSDLNEKQLARQFNETLKGCMKFSDKVAISIIGDTMFEKTHYKNVENTFKKNANILFQGIELSNNNKKYSCKARYRDFYAEIYAPPATSKVYPWGRFKNLLKSTGKYEDYMKQFSKWYKEPNLCPDILNWPGIIVEPDGSLNLCGAFEAVNCKKAHVSNISKPYRKVKKELLNFYEKERQWLLTNQEKLRTSTVSGCKLINNAYM